MVLDDVEIVENGPSLSKDGECVYKNKVRKAELEWLAKDLALVDKSTPVVLAIHVPLLAAPGEGVPSRQILLSLPRSIRALSHHEPHTAP